MREKLIELIGKATSACVGTDCFEGCKYYAENDCRYKLMADALIANGVTVTDNNVGCKTDYCSKCHRAMRTDELFIVINPSGRRIETVFNFCPACGRKLPEPPKGE